MNTTNLIIAAIVFAGLFYGCSDKRQKDDRGHGHAEEQEQPQDIVHLVQQQMDVMNIELGTFQELDLTSTIKTNGQLELPPQNKASVSAILGGLVKSIRVIEGDYVRRGQTLAELEHPEFVELQEEYHAAHIRLAYLEKEYERKKTLFAGEISSAESFQKAEADYKETTGAVNALKAKLAMLDIEAAAVERGDIQTTVAIKAPINGFVRMVEVNIGAYVDPEREMFEIIDNEHIHIDLTVYEKDIYKVRKDQKVMFSLISHPDSVYEGRIFALGKAFENDPKAVLVHAEIENDAGELLPGQFVDARIVTEAQTVTALPNDAIVMDGGLHYIFVKTLLETTTGADDHSHDHESDDHGHDHTGAASDAHDDHSDEHIFKKIEVNIGAQDIGFTEATPVEQLPDNAEIVIKGAYYLLAELKKGAGGGAHGHHH